MGLFTNKPQASDSIQLYSMGLSKTLLLVGLGNPGTEYDLTRHNIGFYALDAFVSATSEFSGWISKNDLKCQLTSGQLGDTRVIAIKPTTYMNLSGESVQADRKSVV
jgi:PTH1 family peptidyl-tRNA hydrolase